MHHNVNAQTIHEGLQRLRYAETLHPVHCKGNAALNPLNPSVIADIPRLS